MKQRFGSAALIIFVFITVMTFFPSYGAACSCIEPPGVKEEFSLSKAVFSGKVIEVEEKKSITGLLTKSVLFEINETWKGAAQSQVEITTGNGGGDCGYEFKGGQEYLVYANDSDMFGSNELTAIICSRTTEISAAQEDLAILGEGQIPAEQINLRSTGQGKVFFILTAVAVISFFSWLYFRKRAKKGNRKEKNTEIRK
ncbi:hypothetical protein [Domibacillus tundrae]|uniref:hypothetical protein n=1 Tax=Domibacillus tundrae TaxID=1587527 RepID=UPI003394B007